MLEDCEVGKIQQILTKSISRFARNTVDLLETVRHLKDIGVEVWFEKENIHSFDGDGDGLLRKRIQNETAAYTLENLVFLGFFNFKDFEADFMSGVLGMLWRRLRRQSGGVCIFCGG